MIRSHTHSGVIFMLLSVFFFSTQDVQVKYLSSYYNIFFIIWIKSITQLLVVFAFLHIKSKKNYSKFDNYHEQIYI